MAHSATRRLQVGSFSGMSLLTAFDAGRLTSDGGLVWLAEDEFESIVRTTELTQTLRQVSGASSSLPPQMTEKSPVMVRHRQPIFRGATERRE